MNNLIARLTNADPREMSAVIGFDGFVDLIYRVVKYQRHSSEYHWFCEIKEFADHIRKTAGKSGDMEIQLQRIQLGGNGPLLANALAKLECNVNCIGTFGNSKIHSVFEGVPSNCNLISIEEPCHTYAFEFNDGKLMFGQIEPLHHVNWAIVKTRLGLKNVINMVEESDLVGITNWSAITHLNTILDGILTEVVPYIATSRLQSKWCFFDIADPSKRTSAELQRFLETLGLFAGHMQVALSLNEKEARMVAYALQLDSEDEDLIRIGQTIFDELSIQLLTIHWLKGAIGFHKDIVQEVPNFYTEKPRISTGGGDNFNAGFCMGQLMNMPLQESLLFGNAVSSFYVTSGFSPNQEQLIEFLKMRFEETVLQDR